MEKLRLPVGLENFDEIRTEGYYYVDKTQLISKLLQSGAKVNLFTRPRRFGKTLNMSMLKSFFEIGADPTLFDGLAIAKEKALCEKYMGKYPVIFLSLKGIDSLQFDDALVCAGLLLREEALRHRELLKSDRLPSTEKELLETYMRGCCNPALLGNGLRILSQMLYAHYGQKVVLLIDEYDVPLDKAYQNGYYREMVSFMRSMLGEALKTNDALQFSVLTGCLRVSKESIFTGLNNFEIDTIVDAHYDEHFGFVESEVQEILRAYGMDDAAALTREWYNGYLFGNANVYCPWDVINFVKRRVVSPAAKPQAFWINSSANALVKRFVVQADYKTRDEIERLIRGESIRKRMRLDLTYDELESSIDNMWSVLFTTGYLTLAQQTDEEDYELKIPNREVREVFISQIQEWFRERVTDNAEVKHRLNRALIDCDTAAVEQMLNELMNSTLSVLDIRGQDGKKENFYHGLLVGLLQGEMNWSIVSNRESGDGFCDIMVESVPLSLGIVIEVKYARTPGELKRQCEAAMAQIIEKRYDAQLRENERRTILAYGIAFCRKECRIIGKRLTA